MLPLDCHHLDRRDDTVAQEDRRDDTVAQDSAGELIPHLGCQRQQEMRSGRDVPK
jgi:hypothetical protein